MQTSDDKAKNPVKLSAGLEASARGGTPPLAGADLASSSYNKSLKINEFWSKLLDLFIW